MAAAAAVTPVGTGGSGAAATSRFAAACGALSQYVKAAEAERMHATRPVPAAVPVRPLPLMPGADVSDDDGMELAQQAASPAPATTAQMMTIVYGGRVLVLDDVPADKAAGLLRLAASAAAAQEEEVVGTTTEATVVVGKPGGQAQVSVSNAAAGDLLLPVARKASLQRFMEKRKVRVAAKRTEPYRRPDACPGHLKLAL